MRNLLLLLALAALLASPGVSGRQDDLEEWQRRILEAIEEAEQSSDKAERRAYSKNPDADREAARAAERARKRYGGKVLAVVRSGDGYRVRLLGKDGRVSTVTIRE